jgi:hypothetical protein
MGRVALERSEGWLMQIAVNLGGLAAMVAIAAVGAWYRQQAAEGDRRRAAAAGAAPENAVLPAAAPNRTMAG